MSTKQVVVAEDNRVLLDVIRFNLKRAGFEVHTAVEGAEALRLLHQHPIDLLITDCQMPGMSGLDLCSQIRNSETFKDLPILFCTPAGTATAENHLQAIQPSTVDCTSSGTAGTNSRDVICRLPVQRPEIRRICNRASCTLLICHCR